MIGIIAAMNVEMESLRSHIENPVTEVISGIRFVRGMLEGKEVVTAVCGIGKVFAAMCAQTMILRYSPEMIINTGVAGTLTDKLGMVLLPFPPVSCSTTWIHLRLAIPRA